MELFFTDILYPENMMGCLIDTLSSPTKRITVDQDDFHTLSFFNRATFECLKSFYFGNQECMSSLQDGYYKFEFGNKSIEEYLYGEIENCRVKKIFFDNDQYNYIKTMMNDEVNKYVQIFEQAGEDIYRLINGEFNSADCISIMDDIYIGNMKNLQGKNESLYNLIVDMEKLAIDSLYSNNVLESSNEIDQEEDMEME